MKKTDSVSSLVIGTGEVGSAIAKILGCEGIDKNQQASQKTYKFLHICFPYTENFIEYVKAYQDEYSPDCTIIHSSIPLGTTRKLNATHSPIRGIHPHLEEGIRTFVKYFAGEGSEMAMELFQSKGIKCTWVADVETVEAMKIWDTTMYGLNILIEKEMYKYCQKNGLNFDILYTHSNLTYNEGYEKLGHPEFKKYVLKHMEGPIGGHCIKENARLLDNYLAKLLCE